MSSDRPASTHLPASTHRPECGETTADGLRCIKAPYVTPDGEAIPHAGGHFFTDDRGRHVLEHHHLDAVALLSMQPVEHHDPALCPGPAGCATARWQGSGPPPAAERLP